MIGFLFKKWFYDLWDNFFSILFLNFGFLISLSLAFVLPPRVPFPAGGMILFAVLIFWLCLYLCTAAAALREVSDYRRIRTTDLAATIKSAFVPAAVLFTAAAFVFFVFRFTIPAYLGMAAAAQAGTVKTSIMGAAAALFSGWFCFCLMAALQFFPAVYCRLGKRPIKCLKKCIFIFFDNPGFCILSFFVTVVLTLLIIPAPAWPLLYLDEALRLRLRKYDWLEIRKPENSSGNSAEDAGPGVSAGRKQRPAIPWKELLEEDREKTGNRSWASFLFPWKE